MWSGEDRSYDYPGDFDSTEEDVKFLREPKSLTNTVIVKLEPKNIVNLNLRVGHEMFEVAGEFDGNKNQGVRTIIDEIGMGSRKVMESGERPSLEADVFTKNIVKEWTDVNVTEGVMNVNMKEAVMDVNMKEAVMDVNMKEAVMDVNMKEAVRDVNMMEAVERVGQEDIPSTLEKSIGDVMKNHNEPEDSTVTIVIVVVVGVLIIGIIIIAIYLRKRLVTGFVIKRKHGNPWENVWGLKVKVFFLEKVNW